MPPATSGSRDGIGGSVMSIGKPFKLATGGIVQRSGHEYITIGQASMESDLAIERARRFWDAALLKAIKDRLVCPFLSSYEGHRIWNNWTMKKNGFSRIN